MITEITNKKLGIKLFSEGFFGNHLRTYHTISELLNDPNPPSHIAMRYKGQGGGGYCKYDIPFNQIEEEYQTAIKLNYNPSLLYFNDSSNRDDKILIQGEVCMSQRGLELRYSLVKKKMRDAFKEKTLHAHGLKVNIILKLYLDPASYENLIEFLQVFKDHVVEFSTWSKNYGSIPGRNTIIWEVRKY